ncbi:hypothetical protein V8D89_007721 [Ganoderma adspersum]
MSGGRTLDRGDIKAAAKLQQSHRSGGRSCVHRAEQWPSSLWNSVPCTRGYVRTPTYGSYGQSYCICPSRTLKRRPDVCARAQGGDVNARLLDTSDELMCHAFALSWERPNCESMSGANAPFERAGVHTRARNLGALSGNGSRVYGMRIDARGRTLGLMGFVPFEGTWEVPDVVLRALPTLRTGRPRRRGLHGAARGPLLDRRGDRHQGWADGLPPWREDENGWKGGENDGPEYAP